MNHSTIHPFIDLSIHRTVAIIDYGSGNLRSVANAFTNVAPEIAVTVTSDPKAVEGATHLVLPGVGAYGDCMKGLSAVPGMRAGMEKAVFERKIPFLGICVGMQLLTTRGYEHGEHAGLGWVEGECRKLEPNAGWRSEATTSEQARAQPAWRQDAERLNANLKIPHMGWNELVPNQPAHPLLNGIETGHHAYFVHSYHVLLKEPCQRLAHIDYGGEVTAIIARDNIMGAQFHPEKSQTTGMQLLRNFLAMQSGNQ